MKKRFTHYLQPLFYAMPGVFIGALVMYLQGVPAGIYFQNPAYLVLGSLVSIFYCSCERHFGVNSRYVIAILSILCLGGTFLSAGMEGVHRWIGFGALRLNAAYIFLPILLIQINKLLEAGSQSICSLFIAAAAILLFLQPDASMITAFSAALAPILWDKYQSKLSAGVVLIVLIILSSLSWCRLDSLAPVSYVEDILVLAKNSGWVYLFMSIASLLFMLWPFVKGNKSKAHGTMPISLGLFYLVLILSAIVGNFPVPLIGYGISPILGYMISVSKIGALQRMRGE